MGLASKFRQQSLVHYIPKYIWLLSYIFRDCPVCREADIDVRNLFAEKAIVHLPIPCINKQFGCKEEVPYSDKETHENNCTFRPFNCPFIECDEKLVAADVVDHVTLKHAEDFKNRFEK